MAAVSEPTPGSVDASAVRGGVGEQKGASHRCCCSGVPTSTTGRREEPTRRDEVPDPGAAPVQLLLDDAAGQNVGHPSPADVLGEHERRQPDRRRPVDDVDGAVGVALVDLGRDRPDLGAGELGGERLDLALLVGQIGGG